MPSQWRPDRPYNDLPQLPPNIDLETKPVLRQCIRARAALSELKQAAELIPNRAILINTLPLLEARASSRAHASRIDARGVGREDPERQSQLLRRTLRLLTAWERA